MTKQQQAGEPQKDSLKEDAAEQVATETEQGEMTQIPSDELEALRTSLATAETSLADKTEDLLRTQAEMMNIRKRAARDVETARKYALERVVPELLEVYDSLEKGLEASKAEAATPANVQEGTELTLKLLATALKNNGVETVDPAGESFDPEFHQAVSMLPSADHEPNTVIEVFQKGYRLNGRLIRPAMVVVASAP